MFIGSRVLHILLSLNLNWGLGAKLPALGDFLDLLSNYSIFRHVSAEIMSKNIWNLFIIVRLVCT